MNLSSISFDVSADVEVVVKTQNEGQCPCDECPYRTSDRSNLNKHIKRMHRTTSTPVKSSVPSMYICDACGKTYKSRFGLDLHRKNKHIKEYKYVCQVCSKGYNQRVQFRFHLSSHSAVGLDVCTFCKPDFNSSGSLSRHLESCQQKPKEHVCDICQKAFSRKYKMDEHNKGKHGEKRYPCERCGKRFGWRSSLKAHTIRCEQ